ncbi:type VI secretion system baseplate subunit TssK [Erythrobacter sp. JK5]|uniref:type VI secretion system baseplate subunit TssK n=1 Tax=Erythrobacter sp. JK5 TaxID=2829500 RepID=UPI001BA8C397|nr:type VI secretion system baseplate subunit TssK [Erythrobacter sp. JK5]QUL36786.1 type VI secretion system baseplate subunit TssK [Erythrobacter sp. JK5]
MSDRNRVAWREGMFLRPQHFQAQDRFFESFFAARHDWALPYSWGFSEVEIDVGLAELGQFAIKSAKGIMPDGTPFSIPGDQPPPSPLAVSAQARDADIYVTLPPRQSGAIEFAEDEAGSLDARFAVGETQVSDNFSTDRAIEAIETAAPNLRFGMTPDETDGRLLLGVARVREVSGKKLVFDDRYIPPALDIRATRLKGALTDLIGRSDQMVGELALRAAETIEGGQDTYRAFLLLQTLNRWGAILRHLATLPAVHPERLFENLVGMAGEISTLTRKERRPPELPEYDHENLQGCFDPVIDLLQTLLSGEFDRSVEPLDLEARGPGSFMHVIKNRTLLKQSYIYLAVADKTKSMEDIRKRFPSVCKIGPNTKMRELVANQLQSGIALRHTTTPPTQLHVLPGYVYFELDRGAADWAEVYDAPALGLFVADDWPELKLELWAVKQKK